MSQNSFWSNLEANGLDKLQFYVRKYKNADEKQREVLHRLFEEECIRQFKEKHKYDELKNTLRITSSYGL